MDDPRKINWQLIELHVGASCLNTAKTRLSVLVQTRPAVIFCHRC